MTNKLESLFLTLYGWLDSPQHTINFKVVEEIEAEINSLAEKINLQESDKIDYICRTELIREEHDRIRRKTLWTWNEKIIQKVLSNNNDA